MVIIFSVHSSYFGEVEAKEFNINNYEEFLNHYRDFTERTKKWKFDSEDETEEFYIFIDSNDNQKLVEEWENKADDKD